ncbi:MAG: hypothetical protein Q7R52_04285 [archaeon]|nr:hypothetical protein [archaeon]
MKRVFVFGILFVFLISFAYAAQISYSGKNSEINTTKNNFEDTNKVTASYNDESDDENNQNETDIQENDNEDNEEECEAWECTQWSTCLNETKTRTCTQVNNCTNEEEMPKLIKNCEEKEKLGGKRKTIDCPEECTCSGSTMKCTLQSGREMTIIAGKSGNVIVQVKGVNMSTKVTLYKADDGKLYGTFEGNETKEVKVLPEQIQEKIKERIHAKIQNQSTELDENGMYQTEIQKKVKFIGLFPVKEKVKLEIDSETGEVIKTKTTWWGFLAKDEVDNIVGGTCATVSPNSRDECCMNKGFEYYKADTAECLNKIE